MMIYHNAHNIIVISILTIAIGGLKPLILGRPPISAEYAVISGYIRRMLTFVIANGFCEATQEKILSNLFVCDFLFVWIFSWIFAKNAATTRW
jgi:hypothetical protein